MILVARRLPKLVRATDDIDELWKILTESIGARCVAILELGGTHDHWTVATRVCARTIRLFDSDRMFRLRRKRCTIGEAADLVALSPQSIVLIERRFIAYW